MTMTLTNLLTELATLYRRYGNVEVLLETPTDLLEIARVDADIFNTKPNDVRVIIESAGVEETETAEPVQLELPSTTPDTEAEQPPKIPTQRRGSSSRPKSRTR